MSEAAVIRDATADDADAIGRVHAAAWQWAYRGLMPDELLDSIDPARRALGWTSILADHAAPDPIVAELDGSIVGFAHASASRDEDADDEVGEVTCLYLDEACIGTGIGWALWQAACVQLQVAGHRTVTLWVLDTNIRGRGFYERVGMRPDGATKREERRGMSLDEVRYRGELDQVAGGNGVS
jgi:ribosomal protein S18 acetylase RimI-like enzyme